MRRLAVLVPVLAAGRAAPAGAQVPAAAPARADDARVAVWGGAGLGLSSAGALLHLDVSHHRAARLLRGRLTAHSNLGGLGTRPDESVTEVSALVGRGAVCCGGNWGSASAGGGVVLGRLGSDATQFTTVGLAAEAALVSRRRPHLAVTAFANANPKRSFAGVSLSLVLGRVPFAGR
jgi:hypothetical protein